jgi:hypothetical protein
VPTNGLASFKERNSMKTLITTLALTSLVATSAVAKSEVHSKHIKRVEPAYYSNIYESDSLGHQSYPNPDRVLPVPDHYP